MLYIRREEKKRLTDMFDGINLLLNSISKTFEDERP